MTIRLLFPAFVLLLAACDRQPQPPSGIVENPAPAPALRLVKLDWADSECARQGYPLAITIANDGTAPTERVGWSFRVHAVGHSDELAPSEVLPLLDRQRMTDRIVQPGSSIVVCSTAPTLTAPASGEKLDYAVVLDAHPEQLVGDMKSYPPSRGKP